MKPIGKILKQRYPEGELHFEQKWARHGFTIIANGTLANSKVSISARLLYTLLLRRAFGKGETFPGQNTLARELGVSTRQVRNLLKELETLAWLKTTRRGQGKTNVYYLNFLPNNEADRK